MLHPIPLLRGRFDAVPSPEVCLDFNLRKWRLVEELLRHNADLIAVQECDHFSDFFAPVMAIFGYKAVYCPKDDSPCLGFGYYTDGVALFYRADVWELAHTQQDAGRVITGYYRAQDGSERGQGYIVAPLLHKTSNRTVVVATTHLKAKISNENEAIRESMIIQLLGRIAAVQETLPTGTAVVLAADFNADSYDSVDSKTGDTVPALCVPAVVRCAEPKLASAYPLPTSEAEFYTTWKKRGAYEAKHCIDYIWHSADELLCTHILPGVDEKVMDPARLPGFNFPSDHLSLVARLRFAKPKAETGIGGGGGERRQKKRSIIVAPQVHNIAFSGHVEATEAAVMTIIAAAAATGADVTEAAPTSVGPSGEGIMFLLDLSGSMYGQLHVAKRILKAKISDLVLQTSVSYFNVAGFSEDVDQWMPTGCVRSNKGSVDAACAWVSTLGVKTSTNTLNALNEAHNDPLVTQVVLLSDGLPDCHPRHIYAALRQAGRRPIPIDTIAFNCSDQAKAFLSNLAETTGGNANIADISDTEIAAEPPSPSPSVAAAAARMGHAAKVVFGDDGSESGGNNVHHTSVPAPTPRAAMPPPSYPEDEANHAAADASGGDNSVNAASSALEPAADSYVPTDDDDDERAGAGNHHYNATARLDNTQAWNVVGGVLDGRASSEDKDEDAEEEEEDEESDLDINDVLNSNDYKRDGEKQRLEFVKLSDECRFHELAKPKPNHARDKQRARREREEQAVLLQRQQKLLAQQNRSRKQWERELTAYKKEERALYTSNANVTRRVEHQKQMDKKASRRDLRAFEAKCEKDRARLHADAARVQEDWEETVAGETMRAAAVRGRLERKRADDEQYELDLVHMDGMRRAGEQARSDKVTNSRDTEARLEQTHFETKRNAELRRRELHDHRHEHRLDEVEQDRIRTRATKNAKEQAHQEEEDAALLAHERTEDKSVQRVKRRLAKERTQKEKVEAVRINQMAAHNRTTAGRSRVLTKAREVAAMKEDALMSSRRTKRRNLEDTARGKEDAAYNRTIAKLNASKRPMEESPLC